MHFDPALPIGRRRGEFWGSGWGVLAGAAPGGGGRIRRPWPTSSATCTRAAGRRRWSWPPRADGVPLEPGQTLGLRMGLPAVPGPAAPGAARRLRGGRGPRDAVRECRPARRFPAWTHWYQYFQDISEEKFLGSVRALAEQRGELAFGTAQLDDGYQSAWGDWLECNAEVPARVGRAGRPRCAPAASPPDCGWRPSWSSRAPDWSASTRSGSCATPRPPRGQRVFLLLLREGPGCRRTRRCWSTWSAWAKRCGGWGFGFIKADFCYAGALPGRRHDPSLTRAQALRRGLEALRRGLGEKTFLLGCGCPYGPALGVVDAMRIGPDTAPGWQPELWSLPWTRPLLRGERSLPSLRNALRHTLAHSALHRRWWWNDPDCLLARDFDTRLNAGGGAQRPEPGGPERRPGGLQRRARAPVPGAPALAGPADPRAEPRGTGPGPAGAGNAGALRPAPVRPVGELARGAGGQLAGPSPGEEPGARAAGPARRSAAVRVRLLGPHLLHGTPARSLDLGTLAPHASRLLRLCLADGPGPCLAGSTLHITQGLEVAALRGGGRGIRVVVELRDLGRPAEGELWLALPGGKPLPVPVTARGKVELFWDLRDPSPRE